MRRVADRKKLANSSPTDIALSQSTIAENSANGTVVGVLSATDPDPGEAFTFALLDDAGGRFAISGAALVVAGPLDYESANVHSVVVRVTDSRGQTFDETFAITVGDVSGVPIFGTSGDDSLSSVPPLPFPASEGVIMIGGDSNDRYTVFGRFDLVIENPDEGIDTVDSYVSYTLPANVENLHLLEFAAGAVSATGNELDNVIAAPEASVVAGLGGADTLIGGQRTRADYSASPGGIAIDLQTGQGSGGDAEGDLLIGITKVSGSAFDDTLSGSPLGDILSGGAGNDALYGLLGNDTLNGGEDDDTLEGGQGDDTLTGGSEADVFRFSSLADLSANTDHITDFESGLDTIDLSSIPGLQFIGDAAFSSVAGEVRYEFASLTTHILIDADGDSAADKRIVIDNGRFDVTETFAASNILTGTSVNSPPTDITLSQNTVAETSGNGTVVGALSATDPDSGDALTFSLIDDEGGRFAIVGTALVVSGPLDYETAAVHAVTVHVTDPAGEKFDETFNITVGDVAGVTINGTQKGDVIDAATTVPGRPFPTSEGDTIDGLGGKDTISGGAGADILYGGEGKDRIIGGADADTLYGGAGADEFIYTSIADFAASPLELIGDFAKGDKINLAAIDANVTVDGNQAFTFIGAGAFTNQPGQLAYVPVAGEVVVSGDLNGDGAADVSLSVLGVASLAGMDFVL